MEEEVLLIASSSVDSGIGSWNLESGAELFRYKNCASPSHGLTCLGQNLIASSQAREAQASSGSILYWTWNKAQVLVKSFPEEPVNPLLADSGGNFLYGGGVSGNIFLWEVCTGRLLRKWRAHYRAVSCLIFNDDESLLISGSEDGAVKVWPLHVIFDDDLREQTSFLHLHHFSEHMEGINSVVAGCGGGNAIIISASKDRTCKVWSLSRGIMLRSISLPSEIVAVALDPGEHVFYAGGIDGKIYIAALHADCSSIKSHVLGTLSGHCKITCLGFASHENLLLAGLFDGTIKAWDPVKRCIVRAFKHEKGPISNVRIVRRPVAQHMSTNVENISRRNGELIPPPLAKYLNSPEESAILNTVVRLKDACYDSINAPYMSCLVLEDQIKELQQQDSSSTSCLAVERLKVDSALAVQSLQKWRAMHDKLLEFCVNDIVDGKEC